MTTQSFIERHGLWTDDQRRQAGELRRRLAAENLQFVRLAWADPHGASRAKAVTVPAFIGALECGYNINVATTTLVACLAPGEHVRLVPPPTRAPSRRSRAAAGWVSTR